MWVKCLAQGLNNKDWVRTSNPPVTRQPALPSELMPPSDITSTQNINSNLTNTELFVTVLNIYMFTVKGYLSRNFYMFSWHCCVDNVLPFIAFVRPFYSILFYSIILLLSYRQCWENWALSPQGPARAAFCSQIWPHLCLQKVWQQEHRCVVSVTWTNLALNGSGVTSFLLQFCDLTLLDILIPVQKEKQLMSPSQYFWQFHWNFGWNCYCLASKIHCCLTFTFPLWLIICWLIGKPFGKVLQ